MFKIYSDANPPQRGTAKKIYQALRAYGYEVEDLHYNPNNWQRFLEDGWATWACTVCDGFKALEYWCGWDKEHGAYLQGNSVPFAIIWLDNEFTE